MKKYFLAFLFMFILITMSSVDALSLKLTSTNIKVMNKQSKWIIIHKIKYGNDFMYCIEPEVAYGTSNYTKVNNIKSTLVNKYGQNRVNKAYVVANIGHKLFMDTKKDEYYVATQIAIYNNLFNETYQAVSNKTVNNYLNNINNLAKSYYNKLSFDSKTYEIEAGQSITIDDTNKQLQDYFSFTNKDAFEKSSGLSIRKENNKLIVSNPKTNKLKQTSSLDFTKYQNYFYNNQSFIVKHSTKQDYAMFKYDDIVTSKVYFQTKAISGNIIGYKVDKNNNKPINGVVFGLYDTNNNLIKQTTTTNKEIGGVNKSGVIYFDNIEYGDYYIKEISTLENYYLSNEKYNISVSESKDFLINNDGLVYNNPKITSLRVYKQFESVDEDNVYINASNDYNAVFKAYYDINKNNVIDSSDELIKSFNINSSEGYLLDDINPDYNVLIKEESYKATTKVNDEMINLKYFSQKDIYLINLEKYITNKITIKNDLVKEEFKVSKVDYDEHDIVLKDATYEIYSKVEDKLTYIDEFTTIEGDTPFTFNSKYPEICFIESAPPDGYLLDDTNYCFKIDKNKEDNKVMISNKKIPASNKLPETGSNSLYYIGIIGFIFSNCLIFRSINKKLSKTVN